VGYCLLRSDPPVRTDNQTETMTPAAINHCTNLVNMLDFSSQLEAREKEEATQAN